MTRGDGVELAMAPASITERQPHGGPPVAGLTVAMALPILLLAAACSAIIAHQPGARGPPPAEFRYHAAAWHEGIDVASVSDLHSFTRAAGVAPQIVGIYTRFGGAFPSGEVREILATGALPLIQFNPRTISLASIASGSYDRLLRAYAAAIHNLGRHGDDFPSARSQRAVVPVGMRADPGEDLRGCVAPHPWRDRHAAGDLGLDLNHTWKSARCHLRARWPGSSYVDWIGIDGYLGAVRQPSEPCSARPSGSSRPSPANPS